MYMYKDEAGFYLTNNFYYKIDYWTSNDTCDEAEYLGYVDSYEDVISTVVENGGDEVDILVAMDDFHDEYSFLD